jgi:subtilase family serine protease
MKLVASLGAALAIAACNSGGSSNIPPSSVQAVSPSQAIPQWLATGEARRACTDARPGFAECDVLISNRIAPAISGFEPIDLQKAYDLPSSTKGAGQIIAIVDAYDNPNAASDLSKYRTEFGLGAAKFGKYNQKGEKKAYPAHCPAAGSEAGWCIEEDLDIEMVSAVCPKCTIYLIEAKAADTSDLQTAEAEAVKLGAHIVSNSWGCRGSNDCVDSSYFDTKGVTFLASAGDYGYGTEAPSALASVVSIGGTMLVKRAGKYSETVWDGSGAGCASGITKPSWQKDPKCTYRTVNDASAVACVCVAEYDSFHVSGWIVIGGTSVSTPLIAGVYALAGNATKQNGGENIWTLTKKKSYLHTIKSGTVNNCPPSLVGTYLCKAGTKEYGTYAAPTGWGSPLGIRAF